MKVKAKVQQLRKLEGLRKQVRVHKLARAAAKAKAAAALEESQTELVNAGSRTHSLPQRPKQAGEPLMCFGHDLEKMVEALVGAPWGPRRRNWSKSGS